MDDMNKDDMSKKEDFNFEWLPGFREMMVCQNDSQTQSLLPPEQLQQEEQEMIQTNDEAMIKNPYFIEVSLRDGNSPFRTLIQVVLHWNINHRRQRYYRRQKVFSNR